MLVPFHLDTFDRLELYIFYVYLLSVSIETNVRKYFVVHITPTPNIEHLEVKKFNLHYFVTGKSYS